MSVIKEDHKPLILSTGISLVSIMLMAFYLGAKTQTLSSVEINQEKLMERLNVIVNKQETRDIEFTKLNDSMLELQHNVTDIKQSLKGH